MGDDLPRPVGDGEALPGKVPFAKECPFARQPDLGLVQLAKNKCPAFAESCPFSSAKTREELQLAEAKREKVS